MLDGLSAGDRKLIEPARISFDEDDGYLFVKIDLDEYGYLKTRVKYQDSVLEPKDELHITVISQDGAQRLANFMQENREGREKVKSLVEGTDWSFRKQDHFFWIQEEEGVETVIQMVEVPGMVDFFRSLSEITGLDLKPPPAHVTLFMRGTEKGIGLSNRDVFEQITKIKIELDDLEVLKWE
jgi:hypothetical protein